MAIIKHHPSKNANYGHSIEYLTQKYDEHLDKPILDENGCFQERDEYRIAYFNSSGEKAAVENWEKDCIKTNLKYGKNREKNEIKSHQYILAFEDDDNLSIDEVQKLAETFALEHFSGHQILIGSHPGHAHIVINSVRDQEREKEDWMQKYESGDICRWEYAAGMKHHVSDEYLVHLKQKTMEFCTSRGLNQIDLFAKQEQKKSDQEFHAEKKAEEKGRVTYKEYIRRVIDEGKRTCKTPEEFYDFLKENNVEAAKRGQYMRYKTLDSTQWIRDKTLGAGYTTEAIVRSINENVKQIQEANDELERIDLQRAIEQAKKEGVFSLPTHTSDKGIRYQIGMYNEDGSRRTALECVLILALTMITGEVQEFALPQWQQRQLMVKQGYEGKRLALANRKIQEMRDAIAIAEGMSVKTIAELRQKSKDSSLSPEEQTKLRKLRRTLIKALDVEYCRINQLEKEKNLADKVNNAQPGAKTKTKSKQLNNSRN